MQPDQGTGLGDTREGWACAHSSPVLARLPTWCSAGPWNKPGASGCVTRSDWHSETTGFMPRKPAQQDRLGLKCNLGEQLSEAKTGDHSTRTTSHPQARGASGYTVRWSKAQRKAVARRLKSGVLGGGFRHRASSAVCGPWGSALRPRGVEPDRDVVGPARERSGHDGFDAP